METVSASASALVTGIAVIAVIFGVIWVICNLLEQKMNNRSYKMIDAMTKANPEMNSGSPIGLETDRVFCGKEIAAQMSEDVDYHPKITDEQSLENMEEWTISPSKRGLINEETEKPLFSVKVRAQKRLALILLALIGCIIYMVVTNTYDGFVLSCIMASLTILGVICLVVWTSNLDDFLATDGTTTNEWQVARAEKRNSRNN